MPINISLSSSRKKFKLQSQHVKNKITRKKESKCSEMLRRQNFYHLKLTTSKDLFYQYYMTEECTNKIRYQLVPRVIVVKIAVFLFIRNVFLHLAGLKTKNILLSRAQVRRETRRR